MSINYLPFAFPNIPHVRCAFQIRTDGATNAGYAGGNISYNVGDAPDAVMANRTSLLEALQPHGLVAWAGLLQVHGDTLVFEPCAVSPNDNVTIQGDGMATVQPGLGLLIKTADCQPILLAHKAGGHIAAIHVGWRGNRCHFPEIAVERFCMQYALEPRDLVAVRGPSLGPGHAEFINFEREWGATWQPWFDTDSRTMDLWALTRAQLKKAGLLQRNIYGLDWCTAENNDLFFSYRRHKSSGRQASLIWIAISAMDGSNQTS